MSDLSDLAADVSKDLPASVRKVIDAAIENGWELNAPGVTLCLRLNHPTDDIAQPVYVTWTVGRTAKGNLSFRFMSCGTRGLVPLSGADLLEYLEDATVGYPLPEELEADYDAKERAKKDKGSEWNRRETPEYNTMKALGGEAISIDVEKPARGRRAQAAPRPSASQPPKSPAPPLRVSAPKA